MTRIIGITGYAGAGKDTFADILHTKLQERGYRVAIVTFAEAIRNIAKACGLRPFDREHKEVTVSISFEHFELTLIEAITKELELVVGEDDLCELYASFVTVLRNQGYLVTNRRDVLTISPRRFCQLLGTEGGRAVRDTFWIDVLKAGVKRARNIDFVLVPDVRFPNEALAVDRVASVYRGGVAPVEAHESESHIENIAEQADFHVDNTESVEHLAEEADRIAGYLEEVLL